jgi:DNA-binding XRE family transcriptional regulator
MKSFNLNEQIAYLRKKNNMTQEKFAQSIGVTNQSVSKWETGACCPDIQLLPVIADCFRVSIDALFSSDDYESRAKLMTRYSITNRDEDYEAAVSAYEKVILSCDATTDDRRDYAYLFDHRANEYMRKAEKLYETAVALGEEKHDESYYRVHIQLILLMCRTSRSVECIARYTQRIQDDADNWWNHYLLSLAYLISGKTEEAWKANNAAMMQFGSNMFLSTLAGEISENQGRYEDAFHYWEEAYTQDSSKHISCLYSIAFLLEKLSRRQEAIEAWQRIVNWHHEHNSSDDHETDMPLDHIEKLLA